MVQVSRRTCGGKRLHLPPSWPLNKISGSRSDLGHALSARTNSTTASESPLTPSNHVRPTLEAKGQPGSTMNSSPNFSNSETASMVALAKINEPRSAPIETQPQQSAETGTEGMPHTVCTIQQENKLLSRASHEG